MAARAPRTTVTWRGSRWRANLSPRLVIDSWHSTHDAPWRGFLSTLLSYASIIPHHYFCGSSLGLLIVVTCDTKSIPIKNIQYLPCLEEPIKQILVRKAISFQPIRYSWQKGMQTNSWLPHRRCLSYSGEPQKRAAACCCSPHNTTLHYTGASVPAGARRAVFIILAKVTIKIHFRPPGRSDPAANYL